jgi:glycosidase
MKKFISLLTLILQLSVLPLFAQSFSIDKIEPPNWWKGMKWDTLQIMLYGENLDDVSVAINTNDIKILNIQQLENKDYLFVDLVIDENIQPDSYELKFSKDGEEINYNYEIKEREFAPEEHLGFSNEDVVYLIFVDRFNNGDSSNDTLKVSLDEFKYKELNGRHGGDLQGVIDKLDYLKELGITAIWLTPTLENKMYMSYHGYAATNLYKIDERFGSNELYKKLIKEAKAKGIKVIYDHVANHIGINHQWVKNLPSPGWINGTVEDHESANHDKPSIVDIHSNENSRSFNEKGWFTDYMIDLNQANPFLAKYIIQNTLWWIEYAGIDGIREDTYPYANQRFMADWAKAILKEYPNFNIVGEIWTGEPAFLAGFQKKSKVRENFETNLPSLLDFGMRDAFAKYLSGEKGLYEIYKTLAQDYLYSNPNNLMPFIDNHDVDRGMFIAKGDYAKFKIALTILLTSRGIPQIFYGTEIGINEGGHHGRIRKPFPGGFPGDQRNAFTEEGRTSEENEIYKYLKRLIEIRKKYKALATGKLLHFTPYDDTYVYFKEFDEQKIMVVINNNDQEFEVNLSRMKEELGGSEMFIDLMNNKKVALNESGNLLLPSKTARIYLLN